MAGERISILTPSFPRFPGGGSRVYYEHANRLAQRGYHVSVVHSLNHRRRGPAGVAERARTKLGELRAGVLRRRVSWMPVDPRIEIVILDDVDERTALPEADLRVGTYWRTSEIIGARASDGSTSLQLVQAYEIWGGPADRVDATWRLPSHKAVVSTSLRDKGIELGVAPERLHLVPNGLDHSLFRPVTPILGRPPTLAFLAHDNPVKGLRDTIDTVRRVRRSRPDVRVVAFGSGPRPSALPTFVEYLRQPVGQRLVTEIYNQCSVFLCASHSEGWGFPSIESMACGAALVSTRNGGVDDFAQDGDSALLREVGDTAGLADAVLELLGDEKARVHLATRGIASASRYTWEASADAFDRAVVTALGERNTTA